MPVARRRHGGRARWSSGGSSPGDRVKRGDIVAVVETEKGAIEVEIFGRRRGRARSSSSRAPRCRSARVLAHDPRRGCTAAHRRRRARRHPRRPSCRRRPSPRRRRRRRAGYAGPHVRASPLARRIAAELGVDLATRRRGTRPGRRDHARRRRARGCTRSAAARARGSARPRPTAGEHAAGDRRGDGALEARDPALLPRHARST